MDTIHRLQLPFKLDQLTEGLGNCFPIAIIQQLRRPEILSQLRHAPKRLVNHKTGHSLLRQSLHQFIMKSRSPRVVSFKSQYEETEGPANGVTWNQYWTRMTTDRTWVDYWFVQATAWYLQLDIWIIATSSTESNPYIEVSGNLADGNKPSGGPVITLGTKSNCHYQSLLPIEMFHLEFQENQQNSENSLLEANDKVRPSENKKAVEGNKDCVRLSEKEPTKSLDNTSVEDTANEDLEKKLEDSISYHPFIYESDKKLLVFLRMSDDYIMKCPRCLIETKQIIQHISKSNNCKISDHINSFKEQFKLFKESYRKEERRQRMEAYRIKKRLENNEKVKEQQRKHQDASMAKKRVEDNENVKEQLRKKQDACRNKKRSEDNEKLKEQQRRHQDASRAKKRAEDNEQVKEQQRKQQDASRAKRRAEDNEKVKDQQRKCQKACMERKRNHDNVEVKKKSS